MQTRYLELIKSFEGFTPTAKWDYAQHTNGFGTKALYPGEQISRDEAEHRFSAEIEKARQFVEKHAKDWDNGTKAALTSLTFNAGTRWATSGLGRALRASDISSVKSHFLAYTKAGGADLPGLIKRRLTEVTWIGEQAAVSSTKATPDPRSASLETQARPSVQKDDAQAEAPQVAQTQLGRAPGVSLIPSAELALSTWLLLLLDNELLRPALTGTEAATSRPSRTQLGA